MILARSEQLSWQKATSDYIAAKRRREEAGRLPAGRMSRQVSQPATMSPERIRTLQHRPPTPAVVRGMLSLPGTIGAAARLLHVARLA